MTKQELKWRLKDLPDATGIAELVKQGVVTKEEARELLFNKVDQTDGDKVQALEKQIAFLEEMVRELAKNRTVNTFHTTEIIKRYEPYYYPRYWMQSSGIGGNVAMAANNSINLASYAQKLIG
jgi:polyhydroxyalkanoate synthesis regulator phasin